VKISGFLCSKVKNMAAEKEITIYDIASHLHISATTVSRGLKDHPAINKHTRKKIAEAAKELGYRSNTFASSLRTKKTYTIGVIVPRLNSHFMSSALAGMEDTASKHGYNLIITQSLERSDKEMTNAHTLFNKRVDGLLVSLSYDTENIKHFDPFFKKGIPVIFFDRVHTHSDSTNVIIDNYKAAYEVTKHLTDQGYRRIMHLTGNLLRDVYMERFRGYKDAIKDAGIPYDEKFLYLCQLTEEAGKEAAEHILTMPERPDAVFSANDTCAVYCMMRLKEKRVKIPHDIAFAGFNNDPVSKIIEPNLTTVNYSGYHVGEAAINSLIGYLQDDPSVKNTTTVVLRSELIVRNSSLKK
jgi:LacI family transcriptional regulator